MAFYIDEIVGLIEEEFTNDWWTNYGFETDEPQPNQIRDFKLVLDSCEDKIFDKLNCSILSGEYITESNYASTLHNLSIKVGNIYNSITSINSAVVVEIDKDLKDNFIDPIKLAIEFYSDFIKTIQIKFSLSNKEYYYSYNSEINSRLKNNNYDENSNENLFLFIYNLSVAQTDHFIKVSDLKQKLEELVELYRLIREKNIRPNYSPLIIAKCGFLIAKLILRIRNEANKKPVYFIEDSEEKLLEGNKYIESYFTKEYNYSLAHYELSVNWADEIQSDYSKSKNQPLENLSLKQLHRRIKYFKDVAPHLLLLQETRVEVEMRYNIIKRSENISRIYAMAVCLNYAINNEFSLFCEDKSKSINELKSKYYEVISIQEETQIWNLFPQKKLLKCLLERLNNLISNKKALDEINPSSEILTFCKELIIRYKTNEDWTRKEYNYVYQLPIEECFIQIDNSEIDKLFIFSSFLLPLPESKNREEFEQIKNEIRAIESSISVLKNINDSIGALKKGESRSIEILSVFTAIIAFVAVATPNFKIIETSFQALAFMMALSSSLCAFVLLILVAFRKDKNVYIAIFGFILVSILFWGLMLHYQPQLVP